MIFWAFLLVLAGTLFLNTTSLDGGIEVGEEIIESFERPKYTRRV